MLPKNKRQGAKAQRRKETQRGGAATKFAAASHQLSAFSRQLVELAASRLGPGIDLAARPFIAINNALDALCGSGVDILLRKTGFSRSVAKGPTSLCAFTPSRLCVIF